MEYEIKIEKPPIWDLAHKHFVINDSVTFYTYGNVIYNPAGIKLPDHIIAHEQVHMRQQAETNGGPEAWWNTYCESRDFRYEQELEAYRAQYKFYCKGHANRAKREWFLGAVSEHLSSQMYSVGITKEQAEKAISENNY